MARSRFASLRTQEALAFFLAVGLSSAAEAQPVEAVDDAAQTEQEGEEVILVTASRREESLLEVPVAVTAITAQDQRNLVLDGLQDYLRQVPGSALVTSGPEYLQDVAIRGQGSGRLGFSETA